MDERLARRVVFGEILVFYVSVNRNSSIVSRGEDLCGWEISQLLLLHDDLGNKETEEYNRQKNKIYIIPYVIQFLELKI